MRFADQAAANAVISAAIDSAIDSGSTVESSETPTLPSLSKINHIETAPAYGASEHYIGQALVALKLNTGPGRNELTITSKLAPTLKAEAIEPAIRQSLARLNVEYLDCLAIHGINTAEHLGWVRAEMLEALTQIKEKGLIRHIGFSTHGSLELIQSAIATQAFSFINLHYNFFFQRNEAAIAQAHAQDMGIFIISPADKAGQLYTPPKKLKALCHPFDPLLLNYRWLLSDPRITTLSIGPATAQELDWPLKVADSDGPLTPEETHCIHKLEQEQKKVLGRDRCAQCHECLPCPEVINIPEVLRLRNLAVAYDMQAFGQYRYGMFERAGHWFPGRRGDRCTDCGDCLPRCPEKLDIPTLLRDTHSRLKGKPRRRLWDED